MFTLLSYDSRLNSHCFLTLLPFNRFKSSLLFLCSSFVPLRIPYESVLSTPPSSPTIATNTESSILPLTMGAKSNASTTGKTAQDSKPMTVFEWKCPHCSYTNSEDMPMTVFGDTSEAR
jgi:hypothetical protein